MTMLRIIFITMIGKSIATSIVILVLKLLSPILNKKYFTKWKYYIWFIIALHLIIPIQLSSIQKPIEIGIPNIQLSTVQEMSFNRNYNSSNENSLNVVNAQKNPVMVIDLLIALWLTGGIIFLLYHLLTYHFQRKELLRWHRPLTSIRVKDSIEKICGNRHIKNRFNVILSEKASSPMMIGFFTQYLVLPTENYTEGELNFILKHELTHLRRHDLWYKLILLIANTIHWFNPIIYIMKNEASADMEFSCDDEVIKGASMNERKAYAETVLTSIQHSLIQKNNLSTYFYGGAKSMKERIKNIFLFKKKRTGIAAFIAVVLLIVVSGSIIALALNNTPLDYVIRGATLLEDEDWYNKGEKIANGTKASPSSSIQDIANIPLSSNILSNVELEDLFAVTVTNVATEKNESYYTVPNIITNSADMAIYTQPDGSGWYLEKGQTIKFSFVLDLETVATAGKNGGVVAIGYVLNGTMYEVQSVKGKEFSAKITAEADGEYFLYTTNLVSGYQIIQDGVIAIE